MQSTAYCKYCLCAMCALCLCWIRQETVRVSLNCRLMPLLSVQQHCRPWEAMLATLEASGRLHGTRAEYRTSCYCCCTHQCSMPCVRHVSAGCGKRQSECHRSQIDTLHCMLMPLLLRVQQHCRPWEAMLATPEASGRLHGTPSSRVQDNFYYCCICLYTCVPWLM